MQENLLIVTGIALGLAACSTTSSAGTGKIGRPDQVHDFFVLEESGGDSYSKRKQKTISRNQRWLVLGAGTFLAAVVLVLGGCPAESPVKPAGLEQKIEAARTPADHQEIAAAYEQQAVVDREAMERHGNLAGAYEGG